MVVPRSRTNGWSYAGYVENQPVIDQPVLMSPATGYAIELHGDAQLYGDDRADVTAKPKGAQDAASN